MGNSQVSTRTQTLLCSMSVTCLYGPFVAWAKTCDSITGTKGSELMAPRLVRTIGQKDGDMGALFLSHQVPQMLLRHFFLLPS